MVLLDSCDLYLFDTDPYSDPSFSSPALTWTKIEVLWVESVIYEKGGQLSFDFSWQSRILIIAHSSVVFHVDNNKSNVTPLSKLGTEHGGIDRFLALSIASHD